MIEIVYHGKPIVLNRMKKKESEKNHNWKTVETKGLW